MTRPSHGLTVGTALIGAAIGAVLWFLSGWLLFAAASVSSRWIPALSLLIPATVPVGTWQQLTPWNLLLPTLGALLFGGLFGLALYALARFGRRRGRSTSGGSRFLGGWLAAVIAAFVTAAVWALGATLAQSSPTGYAWAFRSAQPDLFASGYFGVAWGWLPALALTLIQARRSAAIRRTAKPEPTDAQTGAPAERRRRPLTGWLVALAAAATIALAVGVVMAQPAAVRAGRIAAGGTADGLPTTPIPTPVPVPPPAQVASAPVTPGADWCAPAQTSLTASGTQGALGHRALTLVLINTSSASCVVDGYPDVAFADAGGHAVAITVQHGSSYLAQDPGASAVSVPAGTSVQAHLSWAATGARDDTARTLWAAEYPGAHRSRLPINTDLVSDSTVTVTAWAAPGTAG